MNKKFHTFLGSITLLRLLYAAFLPLAPQEAYYWNYSRHLDLSYFDHPPMAAYFIKLTTLLGTSAFSIHLAAILLSIPMTIAVYRLAAMLFDERVGFWSAVTINLTFIYALGALIITPDSPMLLFWALIMIACFQIARGGPNFWWILLGIFLGAGFASKYTIVFAGLGALIYFASSASRRRYFVTPWPYIALVSAIVVALPVIYWNYSHEWASFAFQSSRRAGEMSRIRPDFFFGYIGTIIGIYGVIPIPLLFTGIWNSFRESIRKMSPNHLLIVSFSIPLVLFLLPLSLIYWVKMNWTAPAFIGWFIAATAYYFANEQKRWVRLMGRISIIFLTVTFVAIHILVVLPNFYFGRGDYYAGWNELAGKMESVRVEMPEPYFIAGSEYKIQSQLAFHLRGRPETVGNNIIGRSGLQYDYWVNPDTLIGRNAIYVYDRGSDCVSFADELGRYFESVASPEKYIIKKDGKTVREYCIYRCFNYRGIEKGSN
jgi:4-amino-4-deoxy-L-arabinose transferase-like glycosyltransferase